MSLARAIEHLSAVETDLSEELRLLADDSAADPEVGQECLSLSLLADGRASALRSWAERYPPEPDEPGPMARSLWKSVRVELPRRGSGTRDRSLAFLGDLRRLFLMAQECALGWLMLDRAARAARDRQLLDLVTAGRAAVARTIGWLETRIEEASPRAVLGA